ncbi:hypothetical protein HOLleu_27911 [Holothuria leucospilota]|uniref:Endonuclease/exonuclease/phosphatase domain-containing protein n=1 Tax=Holothuria leucospilota TaxID=206669 RepID=A0A9Q1BR30_HOLLE|nr:hypothetical protein HOLleu_27911 [Holothuria leucospilota]
MIEDYTFTKDTESVWCKVHTHGGSIVIGTCYLSPSASLNSEIALHDLVRKACQNNESVVLLGDFNHRTISWDILAAGSEGAEFLSLTQDLFLTQHVKAPTRGENILDLVLTTSPELVENLQVREPFSDHNIVAFDNVTVVTFKGKRVMNFDYYKADYNSMKIFLSSVNWREKLYGKSVCEMYECFKSTLEEAVSNFTPIKKCTSMSKRKPMWMTKAVVRARKKYNLWKRYRETKDYGDFLLYKSQLNKATNAIRKAKRDFERKLAQNITSDTKSFYRYVRSKSKAKERVGPLLDHKQMLNKLYIPRNREQKGLCYY